MYLNLNILLVYNFILSPQLCFSLFISCLYYVKQMNCWIGQGEGGGMILPLAVVVAVVSPPPLLSACQPFLCSSSKPWLSSPASLHPLSLALHTSLQYLPSVPPTLSPAAQLWASLLGYSPDTAWPHPPKGSLHSSLALSLDTQSRSLDDLLRNEPTAVLDCWGQDKCALRDR